MASRTLLVNPKEE
jgi:Xaa-Pro aminopeptidase